MKFKFGEGYQRIVVRSLLTAGVGVVGKALGLSNQILSVALISSALGKDGLQEQLIATSFVAWFQLTLLGMNPAFASRLIHSSENPEAFAKIAKTAFFFTALGALVAVSTTSGILFL